MHSDEGRSKLTNKVKFFIIRKENVVGIVLYINGAEDTESCIWTLDREKEAKNVLVGW